MDDVVNERSCTPTDETLHARRRLLLVGDNAVARALGLILRDAGNLTFLPFPSVARESFSETVNAFPSRAPADPGGSEPCAIVACSEEAWRAVGLLNVWQETSTLFSSTDDQNPRCNVIPVCTLQNASPSDIYAARASGFVTRLKQLITILAGVDSQRKIPCEQIERGFHHYYMALARHSLPDAAAGPHGNRHALHDVVAAIRIVQGAVLSRGLSPKQGRAACKRILEQNDKPRRRQPRGEFAALIPHMASTQSRDGIPVFGTLLVMDDEGMWGEPFKTLWRRCGLLPQPVRSIDQGLSVLEQSPAGQPPVCAALVDIRLGAARHGGVEAVRQLREKHPDVPVVVLSVDDQFSETVFLKRLGVFAYLNKHALAEPTRGRDALSAYRQLRDAIVIAGFVSLAGNLRRVWKRICDKYVTVMFREHWPAAFWKRLPRSNDEMPAPLLALADCVEKNLQLIEKECAQLFHGYWQDAPYGVGRAARQLIRAFGLMNDQWCSLWKAWKFDLDNPELDHCWKDVGRLRWPHRWFHRITTNLRNMASHAVVDDEAFLWIDIWIAGLTLFLKMDGMVNHYLMQWGESILDVDEPSKREWERIPVVLRGLLTTSGVWDGVAKWKEPDSLAIKDVVRKARRVASLCTRWLPMPAGDGFPEGDRRKVSLEPYLCRSADKTTLLVKELLEKEKPKATELAPSQIGGLMLVLELVERRIEGIKTY